MIASRRWQDWAVALIGAVVGLSPLVFLTTWTEPAAFAAYILGGLILLGGILKLVAPDAGYIDFALTVLAAVLFFAPWLAGFTGIAAMAWTAWIGALAIVLVVATLFVGERGHRLAPTA